MSARWPAACRCGVDMTDGYNRYPDGACRWCPRPPTSLDPGPFDRVLDDLADSPSALDCLTVAQSSLAVLLTATAPDERRAALQGVASGLWRDVGVIAAAHDGCEDAAVRDLIADMLALADRLTAHCEDLP